MNFLSDLFSDLRPQEYIELRVLYAQRGKRGAMQCEFFESVKSLEARLKILETTKVQLFLGIAPRASKPKSTQNGASRENVKETRYLWADIDGVTVAPPSPVPPSIVVSSGHGVHLYWELEERVPAKDAEELMQRLAKKVGGDHVWDVTRILRLPGSWNRKSETPLQCVVVYSNPVKYSLDEIRKGIHLPQTVVKSMMTSEPDGYPSRSERDFAVVRGLLGVGLEDASVLKFVSAAPCREKFTSTRYGTRTLNAAKKLVDPHQGGVEEGKTGEPKPAGLYEREKRYYVHGVDRPVSTFVYHPRALIEGIQEDSERQTQDHLVGTLITDYGEWSDIVLSKGAFNSGKDFLSEVPQASAQWIGSDRLLRELLPFLLTQWEASGGKKLQSTSTLGLVGKYWVGSQEVVGEDEVFTGENRPVIFLDQGRDNLHTKYVTASHADLKSLAKKVFGPKGIWLINQSSVVYSLLGWLYACPLKPVLWKQHRRFPILNVHGTRGSGKTATITRILLPLLGIADERSFDSGTTPFVLLALLGASNGLPVSLSEYRVSSSGSRLTRYLLLSYDSGKDSRGRPNQSTQTYLLTAPLIVDGEDALSEAALKERIIQVRMRPETISRSTQAFSAFKGVVSQSLLPLATSYLHYVLHAPNWIPQATKIVEKTTKNYPIPDRVFNNLVVVILGCLHLEAWLKTLGVSVPWKDYQWILETLENVVKPSGRTELLVDEFVEAVVNEFALNPSRRFIASYSPKDDTLGVQVSTAYGWWVDSRRRQGRAFLDLPSIKSQLQERQIDPEAPQKGQYIVSTGTGRVGDKAHWLHRISLPAARDSGLDIPDRIDTVTIDISTTGG